MPELPEYQALQSPLSCIDAALTEGTKEWEICLSSCDFIQLFKAVPQSGTFSYYYPKRFQNEK